MSFKLVGSPTRQIPRRHTRQASRQHLISQAKFGAPPLTYVLASNYDTMAESHPILASRMKSYEAPSDISLPPNSPIILRLDGHTFHRFTSSFARPFDQRIHAAMIGTTKDLLAYFSQATVAYTQSDEITLVFPSGVHSFNQRVQKLGSLSASYCSVRFNLHLTASLSEIPEPKVDEKVLGTAHFDARLFAVPSVEEALNCLIWRCRNDAVRNAISSFARTMYSREEMHGKKAGQLLDMMKTEKGVVFEESVPKWAIEGCLVKKEKFEHEGVNLRTGQKEKTERMRMRMEERGVRRWSEENLKLITERFWE